MQRAELTPPSLFFPVIHAQRERKSSRTVCGRFQGESRFSQVEVDELQLAAGEGFLAGMVSRGFQGVE